MEWMLMPLKRYAEFNGRSRRMEFWMYQLGLWILNIVLGVIVMMVGAASMASASADNPGAGIVGMMAGMGVLSIVFVVLGLGLLIPSIAVAVRRLHDTNRSGFWLLLPIGLYIAIIAMAMMAAAANSSAMGAIVLIVWLLFMASAIMLLVFYCLPGTPGPNKYGPDPLGGAGNLSQTFQ